MSARTRRLRSEERGSATVEFALVLPLVMLMALALLQVGLLVKDQLVVVEAARAGAREGAVSRDDGKARQAAVEAAVGLRSDQIEVDVRRDGGLGGPVAVTVLYRAATAVPLVELLFPSAVELRATAIMRQETE